VRRVGELLCVIGVLTGGGCIGVPEAVSYPV